MLKDFVWFLRESKRFTGFGYLRMIFKEQGLKRAVWFCLKNRHDRKMIKKYGAENYYFMMDRTLEF